MTQHELKHEKTRLEQEIKSIESIIDQKNRKGETDVSSMYERINVLTNELKLVVSQIHHLQNAGIANTNENEKKAASIIAGVNVEIRPSQTVRDTKMVEQTKTRKKETDELPRKREKTTPAKQAEVKDAAIVNY